MIYKSYSVYLVAHSPNGRRLAKIHIISCTNPATAERYIEDINTLKYTPRGLVELMEAVKLFYGAPASYGYIKEGNET